MKLSLDARYGDGTGLTTTFTTDPVLTAAAWLAVILFAYDDDPEELDVVFADREIGIVILYDAEVDDFVTIQVKERT